MEWLERKPHKNTSSCILIIVLLIIDNYDSFTYNLVQRIGEHDLKHNVKREMRVIRNDELTLDEIIGLNPTKLIVSPGPCTPSESGVSLATIQHFAGKIPILGVCLGHQSIASVFGLTVSQYNKPMHGKTSQVFHNGSSLFQDVPNPMIATRYHSLIINDKSIQEHFNITAWTEDNICMAIEWKGEGKPLLGVQFHPESFLTPDGPTLIHNFLVMN